MFEELKVNEFFDMKAKGFLVADGADPTKSKLSTFGQEQFERLVESLPAKSQVLIRMMVSGNAPKTEAEIKALMQ